MYKKYFQIYMENLKEEIFDHTNITITEEVEVLLYPLTCLLFIAEEFDQDLIDLLWWGVDTVKVEPGQENAPSSLNQQKKLAFKLGSLIDPMSLV